MCCCRLVASGVIYNSLISRSFGFKPQQKWEGTSGMEREGKRNERGGKLKEARERDDMKGDLPPPTRRTDAPAYVRALKSNSDFSTDSNGDIVSRM